MRLGGKKRERGGSWLCVVGLHVSVALYLAKITLVATLTRPFLDSVDDSKQQVARLS